MDQKEKSLFLHLMPEVGICNTKGGDKRGLYQACAGIENSSGAAIRDVFLSIVFPP